MNETIPTPEPDDVPPLPPENKLPPPNPAAPLPEPRPAPEPLSMGKCIAIGIALCIGSSLLAFLMPPTIVLGLVAAFVSLFFKGYRGIFLGYALTIGVVLLGTIIYCSIHPLRID